MLPYTIESLAKLKVLPVPAVNVKIRDDLVMKELHNKQWQNIDMTISLLIKYDNLSGAMILEDFWQKRKNL
jgi:hypothetical protein